MTTYSVGTSVLHVVPDFTGAQREVEKFAEKIRRSLQDAIKDGLGGSGAIAPAAKQGQKIGGTLAEQIKSRLETALRSLPTPTIGAATTEAEQKIRDLREQIGTLSARIGVDLSTADAIKQAATLEAQLKALAENSTDIDIKANADQAQRVLAAVRVEAERLGALRPEVQLRADASSFTRTVRTALAETAASLPTITVTANTTPAQREVDLVRQRISQLAADVGVHVDTAEALTDIAALEAQLKALSETTTSLDVRADADQARAALAAIRLEAERLNGLAPVVEVQAEANAGEFARKVQEALAAAQASLPDLVIDADSTDAQRELAAIRTELAALAGKKIDVDITAVEALAEAARLQERLDRLGASSPDIRVSTDTAAASASLARLQTQAEVLAATDPNVDVKVTDSGDSIRGRTLAIGALVVLIGSIAPAIAPIGGLAIGAFGALGSAAAGVLPAVAALGLGLSGVGTAVGALSKADADSAKNGAAAAAQRQQQAATTANARRSEQGAEEALANTRLNVAASAERADRQVITSRAAVVTAEQAAADAITSAQRRQGDATAALAVAQDDAAYAARRRADAETVAVQGVADATLAATDRVNAALANQTQAEQTLFDAQRTALDLQQRLNDARQSAAQSLEDQQLRLESNALAQRQGQLSLADAQAKLQKVLADPTASADSQARAQLAVDQAQQSLKELGVSNARLTQEYADASKAGVEGSQQVTAAQQAILDQNKKITDAEIAATESATKVAKARTDGATSIAAAEKTLADTRESNDRAAAASGRTIAAAQQAQVDATAAVVTAQTDGAARVAAANQAVTDALTAQNNNARQGAESLLSAQRALTGAQAALQTALGATGTAGQSAADAVAVAFAALPAAGQEFARFLYGLKPQLEILQSAAAGSLLPGLQAALTALLPLMPTFSSLLTSAGAALGGLAVAAATALNSPQYAGFFAALQTSGIPALTSIATALGSLGSSFVALMIALQPASDVFIGLLQQMATQFATFTSGLATNPAFQSFLSYITENMPSALAVLGQVFTTIGDVIKGLAPYGQVGLGALSSLLTLISDLSPALGSLLGLLSVVVKGVSDVLGPVIVALTPLLKGLFDGLGSYLGGALAAIAPVLAQVAAALGGALLGVLQQLAPTIPLVVTVIAQMAQTLGTFLVQAIGAAAPLLTLLAGFVTDLLQAVLPLVPLLLNLALMALRPLLAAFPLVTQVVAALLPVLLQLVRAVVPVVAQIVVAFLPALLALVPAVLELLQAFLPLIPVLVDALLPVILALLPVIVQLAGVLGEVLVGVITTVVVPIIERLLIPLLTLLATFVSEVLAPVIKFLAEEIVAPAFQAIGDTVSFMWTNVVQPVLSALVHFITYDLGPAATFLWRNIIEPAFRGIGAVVKFVWENVISPAISALVFYWQNVLGPAATFLWEKIIQPAFNGIGSVIQGCWLLVIKPVLDALSKAWDNIGAGLQKLKTSFVDPLFSGIGSTVSTIWTNTIKPALDSLAGFFTDTLPDAVSKGVGLFQSAFALLQKFAADPVNFVISTVYDDGIRALFNNVADKLQLPESIRLPYVNPVNTAGLPSPVKRATGGPIPGFSPSPTADNVPIWATAGEFMHPVSSVDYYGQPFMEAVRRRAIPRELVQGLASGGTVQQLVSFGHKLQSMGYDVSEQSQFGGVTPGAHAKGSWHYRDGAIDINAGAGTSVAEQKRLGIVMPAMANEYGLRSIFMYPGHYNHAHADLGTGNNLGLGDGTGPAKGGLLDSVASAIGGLWDKAGSLISPFTNLLGGLAEGVGTGPWGQVLTKGTTNVVNSVASFVKDKATSLFGGGDDTSDKGGSSVGAGVERWRATALQALAITGFPASDITSLLRRMNQESSGNPRAINLTDSNARAGHPSKGLMQTIDSTFQRWALPGYNTDVYDPLSNIIASIRYAASFPGGPTARWDRAGGYATGGPITQLFGSQPGQLGNPYLFDEGGRLPVGLSAVLNRTSAPEAVFNSSAERALMDGRASQRSEDLLSSLVDLMSDGNDITTTGLARVVASLDDAPRRQQQLQRQGAH